MEKTWFTHIHYEAVKIALTLHEGKGFTVVARLALLDSRYEQYNYACVVTVQTTLNIGTFFLTLFLHFNLKLDDPIIYDHLKVQLQLVGTPQVLGTYVATLHYQMAYRV